GQPVAVRGVRQQRGDVLLLPSVAVRRRDQDARDRVCERGAVVAADQVQAHIGRWAIELGYSVTLVKDATAASATTREAEERDQSSAVHGIVPRMLATISVRPSGSQAMTVSAWASAVRALTSAGLATAVWRLSSSVISISSKVPAPCSADGVQFALSTLTRLVCGLAPGIVALLIRQFHRHRRSSMSTLPHEQTSVNACRILDGVTEP